MSRDGQTVRFDPLRPASSRRLIAGAIVGPLLWIVAIVLVAVEVHRSSAVALGLLVAAGSFVVSLVVLTALRVGRVRQERRYVED